MKGNTWDYQFLVGLLCLSSNQIKRLFDLQQNWKKPIDIF